MNLAKTSLLNGIAVGARILTSLALNKILAVQIGPAGYAVIGQFQNFIGALATLASGAVNTGVTKYTAENFDDENRQKSIWRTAGTLALIGSTCTGMAIALSHRSLAAWILKDEQFSGVFIWLGAGLVLFTFNGLLLAILNGKKEIGRYVVINIAGSLIAMLVTGILATWWGLYGALVALSINQSIVFLVSLVFCWRAEWFRLTDLVGQLDRNALRSLGKFALMALTSAMCVPIAQMLIRNHLGATFGWKAAGHWEALMRISSLYLTVVTTPLAVYYLPRLSEIRRKEELGREIIHGYRLILPVAAIGAVSVYLLRDWLILTLFSPEFIPMRDLFAWQMMGDTVKIGSWLLGYVLLGKAMVKSFIATEIFFSLSWVALASLMTASFGINGAQMAYFTNYVGHWLVMFALVMRKIR